MQNEYSIHDAEYKRSEVRFYTFSTKTTAKTWQLSCQLSATNILYNLALCYINLIWIFSLARFEVFFLSHIVSWYTFGILQLWLFWNVCFLAHFHWRRQGRAVLWALSENMRGKIGDFIQTRVLLTHFLIFLFVFRVHHCRAEPFNSFIFSSILDITFVNQSSHSFSKHEFLYCTKRSRFVAGD